MVLLSLRSGIGLSLACFGIGAFFLNQSFENSGQDLIVVVLVAPVFCALGLLLLWMTISHYKTFREWERYRQQKQHEAAGVREVFSKS